MIPRSLQSCPHGMMALPRNNWGPAPNDRFWVNNAVLDFSGLICIPHFVVHTMNLSRASCISERASFRSVAVTYRVMSSAYTKLLTFLDCGRSLSRMLKRVGERTDPCGTEESIWRCSEDLFLMETENFLSER